MISKNITPTFTPAEFRVIIAALAYWETCLEDERDGEALPNSHPLVRAWGKLKQAQHAT